MHFSVTSISEELTLPELRELMKTSNQELPEKIRQNYGGVEGLCTRLLTSPDTGNNFIGFRLNRMNDRMIFLRGGMDIMASIRKPGMLRFSKAMFNSGVQFSAL